MFHTIFYTPLYNALVFLSSLMPGGDIGLAIIILTILVKIILLPLYQKAAITQHRVKKIEPEVNRIREEYKNDNETQTKKILELYRTNKINPFSGFLVILIQIPIVIALYWVFRSSFQFDKNLLYSFVTIPAVLSTKLLGIIDITSKSLILAILTGLTQFIHTRIMLPAMPAKAGVEPNFKDDFARSMNLNMRYFMPLLITYIAYTLSSAIALYWITSNVFSILQELYIREVKKDI